MSAYQLNITNTVTIPLDYENKDGIYKIAGLFKDNPEQVGIDRLQVRVEGDNFKADNEDTEQLRNIRGFDSQKLIDAHSDDVFTVSITPKEQNVGDESKVQITVKPNINVLGDLYNLKQDQFNFTYIPSSNVREEDPPEIKFVRRGNGGSLVYEFDKPTTLDPFVDGRYGIEIKNRVVFEGSHEIHTVYQTIKTIKKLDNEESTVIRGCTDPKAKNYNPKATEDDGTCEYEPKGETKPTGDEVRKKIRQGLKNRVNKYVAEITTDLTKPEYELTEQDRFLKYSVVDSKGNFLPIINWVRGGSLQQVNREIDVLDSLILVMESPVPLSVELFDEVSLFNTNYLPKVFSVDLSELEPLASNIFLTPNFKSEVEENADNVFSNYQSFETITGGSGSVVGKKVIDHYLQEKKIKLNTDFTDYKNFVKFSSAEERVRSFYYKVQQLETYESQSTAISSSSDNAIRKQTQIDKLDDDVRLLKSTFDDYETHLFNTSGSVYSSSIVSSSEGIFAEWPKTTPTEQITNGDFSSGTGWYLDVSPTGINNERLDIYFNGLVSQSVSLDVGAIYDVTFDVHKGSLPISMSYNGVQITEERRFPSGSNSFRFTAKTGDSSNDLIINGGSIVGGFLRIDNISVKAKPALKSSTSNDVITWYNNLLSVGRDYDNLNRDSFKNNTPEYLREDTNSEEYILFVDMVGVLMDEIWLYGKELSNLYDWSNDVTKGLSEDLSVVLLNMYANNLDVGFSEKDIWEYVLGINEDDTDKGGLTTDFSFKKQQKETVRRLLTNLPFLLKQKGTRRAIKGLVASYGVPDSTLFIREYGTFQGPFSFLIDNQITEEKQNYRLQIDSDTNLHITQSDSNISSITSVELNVEYTGSAETITFFSGSNSSGGGFTIGFKDTGSNATDGDIQFSIFDGTNTFTMSSSIAPFYSGEWMILAQQTSSGSYEILANQFDRVNGEFDYQISASGVIPDGVSQSLDNVFNGTDGFLFGTFDTYNTKFSGYLDELRMWDAVLTDSNFTEHTKYPKSIKLNNPLEIPSSLKIRVDIEQEFRTDFTGSLPNLVFNPQYITTVSASGITIDDWISSTRTEYISTPNVGESRQSSNKVRYGLTQTLSGNTLTPSLVQEVEPVNIVTSVITQRATQENIMSSGRTVITTYRYVDVNGNSQERQTTLGVDRESIRNTIKYQEGSLQVEPERFFTVDVKSIEPKQSVVQQSKEVIQDVTDINELIIGFSPTQIVDEIITQHFGNKDLSSEYADPTENYTDTYNSLQTLVDNFFQNIGSNQKTKFFIEYIRNFDKTLFNNIKKFVPEKANLTTAIFIEPHLLDRSKAKRLGKTETTNLANESNEVPPSYTTTPPSQDVTLSNDTSQNDLPESNTGQPKQSIIATPPSIPSEFISFSPIDFGLGIAKTVPDVFPSPDDRGGFINQDDNVIVIDDSIEKLIERNEFDENGLIVTRNDYNEKEIFEVRKYNNVSQLETIESEIGALSRDDRTVSNKTYVEKTREYKTLKQEDGKLFAIKHPYTGTKPGEPVTQENKIKKIRPTSPERGFGVGRNTTTTQVIDGITYVKDELNVSSRGKEDSSVSNTSKQTRVVVSDTDDDIKLTVG